MAERFFCIFSFIKSNSILKYLRYTVVMNIFGHFRHFILPLTSIAAVFITGVFIAEYFELYITYPQIDILFHILGGAAIAWLVVVVHDLYIEKITTTNAQQPISQNTLSRREQILGRLVSLLITISITCFIGVLWEFAEYFSSVYAREGLPILYHYFHGGDLQDTLKDIADDMIGAILTWYVYALVYYRK